MVVPEQEASVQAFYKPPDKGPHRGMTARAEKGGMKIDVTYAYCKEPVSTARSLGKRMASWFDD